MKINKFKKLKVSYMGKPLKEIYPYATGFQVLRYRFNKFMEKVVIASFIIGMVYGGFKVGQMTIEPSVTFADREVIKEVIVESPSSVMLRIAKCESGGSHTRNGQVIYNANNNKTVDVGLYQINSIWNKKATELGLDLSIEKDNKAFAMYLYKNYGTEPWYPSKSCWNK